MRISIEIKARTIMASKLLILLDASIIPGAPIMRTVTMGICSIGLVLGLSACDKRDTTPPVTTSKTPAVVPTPSPAPAPAPMPSTAPTTGSTGSTTSGMATSPPATGSPASKMDQPGSDPAMKDKGK